MDDKDAIIKALLEQNQVLQEQVKILTARVAELERRLKLDSLTSGKPPSSDGLSKKQRTKSLREKGKRKPGGQKGHPGKTLKMSQSPDEIVTHTVMHCSECDADLSGLSLLRTDRRQVFDLPKPRFEVIEHRSECKLCSCGTMNSGVFPDGVNAPVQYGARVRALSVYLNHHQLIPEGRVSEIFEDVFGLPLSSATIASYSEIGSERLQAWLSGVYNYLALSEIKHLDETGYRISGKTQWLHVIGNSKATYYHPSGKRGEMFRGLTGIVVHDHFPSYYTLPGVLHALCNAHHLRELRALIEIEKEFWASRMATLLRYANKKRNHADRVSRVYDAIIRDGLAFHEAQSPVSTTLRRGRKKRRIGHNLLLRLRDHKDAVLRFLSSEDFPFTNNQAEQDLRMMKVKMKISGSFRSLRGAEIFAAIRSFTSTCRKQGFNILQAIEHIFCGEILSLPALTS